MSRGSPSLDLARINDALDKLADADSPVGPRALLLRLRQTDPAFASDSCLLFSRLGVLNPNRLRMDEALELSEPVLTDRARFSEFIDPVTGVACPLTLGGRESVAPSESSNADGIEDSYLRTKSQNPLPNDQAARCMRAGPL